MKVKCSVVIPNDCSNGEDSISYYSFPDFNLEQDLELCQILLKAFQRRVGTKISVEYEL